MRTVHSQHMYADHHQMKSHDLRLRAPVPAPLSFTPLTGLVRVAEENGVGSLNPAKALRGRPNQL
jgi:hypothetical protein